MAGSDGGNATLFATATVNGSASHVPRAALPQEMPNRLESLRVGDCQRAQRVKPRSRASANRMPREVDCMADQAVWLRYSRDTVEPRRVRGLTGRGSAPRLDSESRLVGAPSAMFCPSP